jgi:hypothetical protein
MIVEVGKVLWRRVVQCNYEPNVSKKGTTEDENELTLLWRAT